MIKPILLNRALESKHNLSKNPANYLPIQNDPKILSRMSSTSIRPVIFPKARAARRTSSAANSISFRSVKVSNASTVSFKASR